MNNTKIKFVVVFLFVATLLLSAFAVAQQAQRRPPASNGNARIQWDGLKNTKIQRDGLKSSSVKLQEGPLAKPKQSFASRQSLKPKSADTHGVVLPDFKPNPSAVAKARANSNAAFKRTATSTKSIIDPLFKPTGKTEKRGIIVPDFKPANQITGAAGRAGNRATGAVGLESSMKKSAKGTKHIPNVKVTKIAKPSVEQAGLIDPSFNKN